MSKFILIVVLSCFSLAAFAQNQSYKGFYQTKFFNFLGETKIIEAEFEVREDNSIVGKLKFGDVTKDIQGQTDGKGKFEARAAMENGVLTLIKGEFPNGKKEGKAALIQRTEQKGNGSKSVSETGINGFIKTIPPPEKLVDLGIADTGKTLLWIQSSNPYFDKEWANPATASEKLISGDRIIEIIVKSNTAPRSDHYFGLKLVYRKADQKIWTGSDMLDATYYENKFDADGNLASSNRFRGGQPEARSGQIEIISDSENEIILKLTNLKIKRLIGDDFVQIDGYIHALK